MLTKTCLICGAEFETTNHQKLYCSARCAKRAQDRRSRELNQLRNDTYKLRKRAKEVREKRERRLAARDREYAALGVPVTVREERGVVTETRGQARIAAWSQRVTFIH